MSEVDPDPHQPGEGQGQSELGGHDAPGAGDPTRGGKDGQIGSAPSVASDEPDAAGPGYPVGGGDVGEEPDAAAGGRPRPERLTP